MFFWAIPEFPKLRVGHTNFANCPTGLTNTKSEIAVSLALFDAADVRQVCLLLEAQAVPLGDVATV